MILLLYIFPIVFQLFFKVILKSKLHIIYFANSILLLIIGIVHFNLIQSELIKANFHCGMPLIIPFFLTILFEVILIGVFSIQIILDKKKKNRQII